MYIESAVDLRQAVQDTLQVERVNDSWIVYDSPIEDYNDTFKPVLGGKTIVQRVAERAREIGEAPVVIDFMASTAALRSLSSNLSIGYGDVNIQGLATASTDKRGPFDIMHDARKGIVHVPGNIASAETRRQIRSSLGGRKADFILERGFGGLRYLPKHQKFYHYAIDAMWSTLSPDGGQMLIEVDELMLYCCGLPKSKRIADSLRRSGVEVKTAEVPESSTYSVFYIRRTLENDVERLSELF